MAKLASTKVTIQFPIFLAVESEELLDEYKKMLRKITGKPVKYKNLDKERNEIMDALTLDDEELAMALDKEIMNKYGGTHSDTNEVLEVIYDFDTEYVAVFYI